MYDTQASSNNSTMKKPTDSTAIAKENAMSRRFPVRHTGTTRTAPTNSSTFSKKNSIASNTDSIVSKAFKIATTHTKIKSNNRYRTVEDQRQQYRRTMLLLPFPLKLHLLLDSYDLERRKREHNDNGNSNSNSNSNIENCPPFIIGWSPDGKSFVITNKERFVREIMQFYFLTYEKTHTHSSTTKKIPQAATFQTFQRSLKLWGFTSKRVTTTSSSSTSTSSSSGDDNGTDRVAVHHVYSHPYFLKDCPSSCKTMIFGSSS